MRNTNSRNDAGGACRRPGSPGVRQILAALAGPLVWCGWCWAAGSAGLAPLPDSTTPREEPLPGPALRGLVEADWLQAAVVPISTRSDAAGGCDGVKNGKYGFHTGLQRNPWWQVDLGAVLPVARVVVYNRLDYAPGLHNADNLQILLSTDGRHWKLSYENHGRHFGGISGGKPLEVVFTGHPAETRFVRLQAASKKPIYLHLDEVEVYGPQPGSPNLALHRNADQSSVSSSWSTDKLPVAATYPVAAWIARGGDWPPICRARAST